MSKSIKPVNIGCITEFPFLDETFDTVSMWQMLQKYGNKLNEVIKYVNDEIDDNLKAYIDKRFNDIMLDTMYDEETETLTMYLKHTA